MSEATAPAAAHAAAPAPPTAPAADAAFNSYERSYVVDAAFNTAVRVRLAGVTLAAPWFPVAWEQVMTEPRAAVLARLIEVRWGERRPLLRSEVEKLFGPWEATTP